MSAGTWRADCGPGKRSYAGHGLLKAGEQLHWSAPSPDWAWDCRQRVDVEGATGAWALRTWVSGLPVAAATSAAASAHNVAMAKHLCSTKRQRSQWMGDGARGLDGVASTARCAGRARYRSVCRSYTGVTLTTLTGPRRSTSVRNGYRWLVSFFTRSGLHPHRDHETGAYLHPN